ncbi:hypothetical protein W97_01117 [Coniosporium apollinis CBS 100218]|uniref:3'-5' exonuclease domain-containing protein n=1 Tax=Coniosporium apollinis (strain CBS 100218) TaxID=1168221 RepID=R7YJB5_CONA1|nr:uncharacterized protein W97_01117 [Coniosporium apollinis CBS 100218]EON61899.1 hypothetical protein W97_01117 [Coniosporium apollinis CBS 100218]
MESPVRFYENEEELFGASNEAPTPHEKIITRRLLNLLHKYKVGYTWVDTVEAVVAFLNKLDKLGMRNKDAPAAWSSIATQRDSKNVRNMNLHELHATYKPKTFRDLNRPYSIVSKMPALYIDCEGVNLSRSGTLSIFEVMSVLENHVYVFDVHVLGKKAFETAGVNGVTLKKILEDPGIGIAFFDVRNDSDALHHHFGIKLQGVQDIQLMELATRRGGIDYVHGLKRCIEEVTIHSELSWGERSVFMQVKSAGRQALGGDYRVFAERPLKEMLVMYCIVDVALLPMIWTDYSWMVSKEGWAKVLEVSATRVAESQQADYDPHNPNKVIADPGFQLLPRGLRKVSNYGNGDMM